MPSSGAVCPLRDVKERRGHFLSRSSRLPRAGSDAWYIRRIPIRCTDANLACASLPQPGPSQQPERPRQRVCPPYVRRRKSYPPRQPERHRSPSSQFPLWLSSSPERPLRPPGRPAPLARALQALIHPTAFDRNGPGRRRQPFLIVRGAPFRSAGSNGHPEHPRKCTEQRERSESGVEHGPCLTCAITRPNAFKWPGTRLCLEFSIST